MKFIGTTSIENGGSVDDMWYFYPQPADILGHSVHWPTFLCGKSNFQDFGLDRDLKVLLQPPNSDSSSGISQFLGLDRDWGF